MRHKKKILVAGVLLAVAFAYFLLIAGTSNRHKVVLEAYRKQLLAQGEKLTIAEIAPHVTAEEAQRARELTNAISQLPRLSDYPIGMHRVAPGRAMVAWAEDVLPTYDSTNVWPDFLDKSSKCEQDLEKIQSILKGGTIQFEVGYSNGISMFIPHLAGLKVAEIWASAVVLAELHTGHPANAAHSLSTSILLLKPLEHEPLMISQLVRVAMAQSALSSTWEFLQYPDLRDEQLAGIQAQWHSINFLAESGPSLEMERAELPSMYDFARSTYSNYVYFLTLPVNPPPTISDLLFHPIDNYQDIIDQFKDRRRYGAWKSVWSYDEELEQTRNYQAGLVFAHAMLTNDICNGPYQKLVSDFASISNSFTNSNQFFRLATPDFEQKYLEKLMNLELEQQMLVTAIALRRFQLRSGKYPANLKELLPDYLEKIPLDLMDGQPFRYHPDGTNSFVLYSVGEDFQDNGGDPDPSPSDQTYYHPWWQGRDAVWPQPGAREQIEAYKTKLLSEQKKKPASTQ